MFFQGIGQCRATRDVPSDITDGAFERLILCLLGKDIEALNNGKPSIDHGGKLAGKEHHVVWLDLGSKARNLDLCIQPGSFFLYPCGDGLDPLTPKASIYRLDI